MKTRTQIVIGALAVAFIAFAAIYPPGGWRKATSEKDVQEALSKFRMSNEEFQRAQRDYERALEWAPNAEHDLLKPMKPCYQGSKLCWLLDQG